MQNIIDYLETISRTNLQEKVLKFLKDQEFVKNHFRNGGSVLELESKGIKFGKVDLSHLEKRETEKI